MNQSDRSKNDKERFILYIANYICLYIANYIYANDIYTLIHKR